MKWVKLGKAEPNESQDHRASFKYYEDQKDIDKQFKIKRTNEGPNPDTHQTNLWVAYSFDKYMGAKQQQDYEIFCGGFLIYHENVVKNKEIKYELYFEWSPKKNKVPFSVSIYLSPAPLKKESKLQKRQTEAGSSSPGPGDLHKATIASRVAEAQDTQEEVSASALVSIDPPPPPPPPPPPRD